ncbi:hypothetical protein PV327_000857 [Microctonus hyperodae]|uniref:Cilia- and flagella-associated protein 157 n=1 Tax=Microctonus hyperodae TaxID=165561 RepID=A0AA39L2T6_MICHY|nr:hypothetical protein PV327_000857 [Microctonus hyperodae]
MPKKKKKKGGDKEKKAKKKTGVSEREAVFYEQQIQDNNLKISRLRTRNEFLESEFEELKGKLNQLEDDRADVIAHLKRTLQQKVEEARELGERLLAMEELRKEEQTAFKIIEDTMKQDYHNMETNLNAEVKLVAGKLNALEDWRNARAELTQKFEQQEKEMAEQEECHKQTLYEAERSLIIGKAKMQKEMEERLNDLALKFQEATNVRIADATQRAIRENIALHLEFDDTLKMCEDLEKRMQACKEKEKNARLRASLCQKEAEIAHNKVLKQNGIIETLVEEHMFMSRVRSDNRRLEVCAESKAKTHEIYQDQYEKLRKKAEELNESIQKAENSRINISDEIQTNQQKINRLYSYLNDVKRLISELSIESNSCAYDPNFKQKLLEIYDLLESINISSEV